MTKEQIKQKYQKNMEKQGGLIMRTNRTEQKTVKLTPQEVKRIMAAVEIERGSLSAFLRKAALDRADVILANIKPPRKGQEEIMTADFSVFGVDFKVIDRDADTLVAVDVTGKKSVFRRDLSTRSSDDPDAPVYRQGGISLFVLKSGIRVGMSTKIAREWSRAMADIHYDRKPRS